MLRWQYTWHPQVRPVLQPESVWVEDQDEHDRLKDVQAQRALTERLDGSGQAIPPPGGEERDQSHDSGHADAAQVSGERLREGRAPQRGRWLLSPGVGMDEAGGDGADE